MHDTNSIGSFDPASVSGKFGVGGYGFAMLGGLASLTAITAACLMYLILTQPARITQAASEGHMDLAREVLRALIDAVARVLAWL